MGPTGKRMWRWCAAWCWVGLTASVVAGPSTGSGAGANDDDYVAADVLADMGLAKFWQLRLPLEPDQTLCALHRVDDALYACTLDGFAFALDADTGAVRWMRQATRDGERLQTPVHAGGKVVFATKQMLIGFDRLTGRGAFRERFDFPGTGGLAADGLHFYVGGFDNRIYAFDRDRLFKAWTAGVRGAVVGRPVLDGRTLYFVTRDGYVYAAAGASKQSQWMQPARVDGRVSAPPAVDATGVYVACADRMLYRFNRATGALQWRTLLSAPLSDSPAPLDDRIYQHVPHNGLVAIDPSGATQTDRVAWELAGGRQVVSRDDAGVFVRTDDHRIVHLRPADGRVLAEAPTPGLTLAAPRFDETAWYLAGPDGRVFCARSASVPFPRQEDVLRALAPPIALDSPAALTPATVRSTQRDPLESRYLGRPLGGKSQISIDWFEREEAAVEQTDAPEAP